MYATNEDIVDEVTEQLLTCPICMNTYSVNGLRCPKLLSCFHSFCEGCIEGLVVGAGDEIECPSCRNPSKLPQGGASALQSHFFVVNLLDIMNSKKEKQELVDGNHCQPQTDEFLPCVLCGNPTPQCDSVGKCTQCDGWLCNSCDAMHRRGKAFSAHQVIAHKHVLNDPCESLDDIPPRLISIAAIKDPALRDDEIESSEGRGIHQIMGFQSVKCVDEVVDSSPSTTTVDTPTVDATLDTDEDDDNDNDASLKKLATEILHSMMPWQRDSADMPVLDLSKLHELTTVTDWTISQQWDTAEKYEQAEQAVRKAATGNQNSVPHLLDLARFLQIIRTDVKKLPFKRVVYEFSGDQTDRPSLLLPPEAIPIDRFTAIHKTHQRNLDEAQDVYNHILDIDPRHVLALRLYANFLTQFRKDYEGAELLFARALAENSDDMETLLCYTKFLFATEKLAKMEEFLEIGLNKSDESYREEFLVLYASVLLHAGKVRECSVFMNKNASYISPSHIGAICIAASHFATDEHGCQDIQLAADLYDRALKIDGNHVPTLTAHSRLLSKYPLHHPTKFVVELYDHILILDPFNVVVLKECVQFCSKIRWSWKVQECCERLLILCPRDVFAMCELAATLRENTTRMESLLNQALTIDPVNCMGLRVYAGLLHSRGEHGRAEAIGRLSVKYHPNDADGLCMYGNLIGLVRSDREAARAMFKAALAVNPDHIETLNTYGLMCYSIREYSQCVEFLTRCVQLHQAQRPAVEFAWDWRHTTETLERAKAMCSGHQQSPSKSRARHGGNSHGTASASARASAGDGEPKMSMSELEKRELQARAAEAALLAEVEAEAAVAAKKTQGKAARGNDIVAAGKKNKKKK